MSHKPEAAKTPDAGQAAQDLQLLRDELNEIDDAILELLNKRAGLSLRVKEVKQKAALPVAQPGREREILQRLQGLNQEFGGLFPAADIEKVWAEIFASSRAMQEEQ